MNTNHLRPTPHRTSKPLRIHLSPLTFDDRAVFIDRVCSLLIDSRFGPGRSTSILADPGNVYDPDSAVANDVFGADLSQPYPARQDTSLTYRHAVGITLQRLGRVPSVANGKAGTGKSPSTLGRGSPPGIIGTLRMSPCLIE